MMNDENAETKLDSQSEECAHDINSRDAPDPFDVDSIRLSQDFHQDLGVKRALLTIPVRKPDGTWFFRVQPGEEYRLQTVVLELKEEREIYLVSRALWDKLSTENCFSPRVVFTAINRQGTLFLWPIRLPRPDGRQDNWSASALEAAKMGMNKWTRMTANMNLGAYEVFTATGTIPEPEWPDEPFEEILRIAFKDRFIEGHDHPVLKRLRGEV